MVVSGQPPPQERFHLEGLKSALGDVLLGIILVLILGYYLLVADVWAGRPQSGDFLKFHSSAKELIHRGDIYAPVPTASFYPDGIVPAGERDFLHPNLNPPFQTVVAAPLGFLDFRTAFLTWGMIALISAISGAASLGFALAEGGKRVRTSLVLMIVLLVFFPTHVSVLFGQWVLLPFFFLVLAWVTWRKGHLGPAGAVLGFLAAIKPFFGVFFLLFLSRREWRAAIGFVGSWVFCNLLATGFVGLDTTFEYLSIVGSANWFSASWNASFLGFFSRLFGGGDGTPLMSAPSLTPLFSFGCALLALGSLFLLQTSEKRRRLGQVSDDLAFATAIPVMLLASPYGWMYYFSFLIIPLAVLWKASPQLTNGRHIRMFLTLAWLLVALPNDLITVRDMGGDPTAIVLRSGVYFYALLVFWGLAWGTQRAQFKKILSR